MNTPVIKEPTKKTFHFPKSAEKPEAEAAKRPAKSRKPEAAAKAATKPAESRKPKKAEAAPAPAVTEEKARRAKKEKVVRDSFTMPKSDYEMIAELKKRCTAAGVPVKKSELLRAGLQMLAFAPEKRLIAAVTALEQVKTGRPAKS